MNPEMPIGVFDSGMGGLTVLSALMARLPNENIIYLGDTARLPYGTKSQRTVARYALQAAEKLVSLGVKALVIACNTATAAALEDLRAAWPDLPIIGVVEPGAEAACAATKNNTIAVIATESTIRGGAYQRAIAAIKPEASVIGQPCSLFVPLAEEGWMDGAIVEAVIRRYLEPLFYPAISGHCGKMDSLSINRSFGTCRVVDGDESIVSHKNAKCDSGASISNNRFSNVIIPDCLVLGCTHFPAMVATIAKVVNELIAAYVEKCKAEQSKHHVSIVDSAATTAFAVEKKLESLGLLNLSACTGKISFMTTDDEARFARIGSLFLGRPLDTSDIELVNL